MELVGLVCVSLSLLSLYSLCSASVVSAANDSTCPLDFNYALRIAWNTDACQKYKPQTQPETSHIYTTKFPCCQTLLSLYRVAFVQHLKETSLFLLPDLPTSDSCLQDFGSKLAYFDISSGVVFFCLDPLRFVITSNTCAQIQSTEDWASKIGGTTAIDSACRPNLTNPADCDRCISAGVKVQTDLVSRYGNASHARDCWLFTILY